MKHNYSDIALSADGDLIVGPTGALYITTGVSSLKQGIEVRLQTDLGDLFLHRSFGNSIRDMVGKRNTRKVAEEGRQSIISCLTYDGFIDPANLIVVAIPASESEIIYHIEVMSGTQVVYKFDLMCDLENGIRRV